MKYKKLTDEEKRIIEDKGTEPQFSGKYDSFYGKGVYVCKRCGIPLYRSDDKFNARCGWPSFDDEIPGAVKKVKDADGMRTEILCQACGAHLGHVFYGEGFTEKDTRHCVNSVSLEFIADNEVNATVNTQKAYFAGGCFWGVEYHFRKTKGVISTSVGYMGGNKKNPKYEQVCYGNTGHAETVEVVFNPAQISFEELVRLFFEIHDPTQVNRQGPDVGEQYRSEIFYVDEYQKNIAEKLMDILRRKGYDVRTDLTPVEQFWQAEEYHQHYYEKKGSLPYCHIYQKKF